MPRAKRDTAELTYPLRTAARLTGLSPELLRAWERRYGVVEPLRTSGGTRRYSADEIERLRLVKAAVDAGHRISEVAALEVEELKRRYARTESPASGDFEAVIEALNQLDGAEVQRMLTQQLFAFGPTRFAREYALPLVQEIGARWARGRLGIASEHLATGILRTLLGSGLQPSATSLRGPRILFATPSGERHELGLLIAALTALGAGANPLYLGVEVPVEDLLAAAETTGSAALALSVVTLSTSEATRTTSALRGGLSEAVTLWLGGVGARALPPAQGVEYIESLEALEQRVALLGSGGAR